MKLQNHNAEKIILAGMILNPEVCCLKAQSEDISSAHFTDTRCQQIFPVVTSLWEAGNAYLIRDLSFQEEIQSIASRDQHFLHDLSKIEGMYAGQQHWETYLKPLKQAKARREAYLTIQRAQSALEHGEGPGEVADILREGSEKTILSMESVSAWKGSEESTKEFVIDFECLIDPDKSPGIPTGCEPIDSLTGGMRPGELWVMCGQTSSGKSVAALQFAANALGLGKQVALFSLEMGAGENIARIMCNTHDIHFGALRNPNEQRWNPRTEKWDRFTHADKAAITSAVSSMKDAPLRVVDEGGLTIERIEAICVEMCEQQPLDLVVIDYVQLVTSTRQGMATHEELSYLVARMKQMAKKFSCPVVTASQLNDDGRLAQSRAIGHHADVVLQIMPGDEGIYVTKNRNGRRDLTLPLHLEGAYQRFITKPEYARNSK